MSEGSYCVYKHTSPSGKSYIGITGVDPEKRWAHGKNYKYNPYLTGAINKYGWDNFRHEIICHNLSLDEAKQKEIELIAEYNTTNRKYGYNITAGGDYRFSGENHPLYGKKRPPEVLEKMSQSRKGVPWSEYHRKSVARYYATHKNWNYGKTTSQETRNKLSLSHLGQCRPHSEKTKQKISRGNDRFKKAVIQFSLDGEKLAVYPSVSDAARYFGGKKYMKENIRQCCYGMRKSACGYTWSFVEEENRSV